MNSEAHRVRTLWLCGVLHAFTHIYHVALLPLYLLIREDLKLEHTEAAPLLVTIMGLAYFVPSYPVGILADRYSRKKLLALGLLLNASGFIGLSLAHSFSSAVLWVVVAGVGGSFFHPTATALIVRLYPEGTGRALGLIGVGASAGFFLGPIFTGWRATIAGDWRTPIFELGVAGVIGAVLFAWLAEDERPSAARTVTVTRQHQRLFPTTGVLLFFVLAGLAFSLRDFAGGGMGTMSSLFLQQAHGLNPELTGLALSAIFLASVISNPLLGGLSDRGRTRWTGVVLILAAALVVLFPRVPPQWSVLALAAYGFFFLASYPMVEATLLLSVPDAVRGRVFGLFITIGGLIGTLSHWAAGNWVRRLGPDGAIASNYYPLYAILAGCIVLSLLGLPCLRTLRQSEGLVESPPSASMVTADPTLESRTSGKARGLN